MTSKTLRRVLLALLFTLPLLALCAVLYGLYAGAARPPLYEAVKGNNPQEIVRLLEAGEYINENPDAVLKGTPLILAVTIGAYEAAETLVQQGADVNAKDMLGNAPLHHARDVKIAELLLDNGARLEERIITNPTGRDEGTPLHSAAYNGRYKIVSFLLERGADINARDGSNNTPLHHAVVNKHAADTVYVLLKHGADIHAQNKGGSTPLSDVWLGGSVAAAKMLIEHGADVNVGGALHGTAHKNTVDIAALLIEHGADVNVVSDESLTPLHSAAGENSYETAKLLLKHGADVHVKTKEGTTWWHNGATPLHLAVWENSYETAELLLQHGANARAENDEGKVPLHFTKNEKMRALLRKYSAQ